MESLRKKTIAKILEANEVDTMESSIVLAIHKLEAHKVNQHLIMRFISKIEDQIESVMLVTSDSKKRELFSKTLKFLKNKE